MVEAGWSPSVRLFEAAACGTPIVSDRWEGLDALFPDGEAILICDEAEQVMRALTKMSDAGRKRMASLARRRVLERHTGGVRAAELVVHIREVRKQSRAPVRALAL